MPFQPLTKEQYQGAIKSGFSHDQIVQNELRRKSESPDIKAAQYKTEAEQYAKEAKSPVRFTKNFTVGALKTAGEILVKPAARFGVSTIAAPVDLTRTFFGKEPIKTEFPYIGKTFQREGAENLSAIQDKALQTGNLSTKDYAKALQPFAEVPAAGAEFLAYAKAIPSIFNKGKQAVEKGKTAIAERRAKSDLKKTLEATQPVYSKAEKIQVFEKAGKPGGATETGTIFKKIEIAASKRDIEIAKAAQPFINTKASPVKNVAKISNEIERVAEKEVRPFLQKHPQIYNNAALNTRLKAIEKPDIVKSDPTLERAYDLVRERVMKTVGKNKHTMEGLWDSRKELDATMKKEFGEALYNSEHAQHVPVKRAYLDMRREINQFIVDSIGKKEGGTFAKQMEKLSNLYDARHNISEQSYKYLGQGAFKQFQRNYPRFTKTAEVGLTGAGIYQLGQALIPD